MHTEFLDGDGLVALCPDSPRGRWMVSLGAAIANGCGLVPISRDLHAIIKLGQAFKSMSGRRVNVVVATRDALGEAIARTSAESGKAPTLERPFPGTVCGVDLVVELDEDVACIEAGKLADAGNVVLLMA